MSDFILIVMRIHHKPPQEEAVDEAFYTQLLSQDLKFLGLLYDNKSGNF